MDTYANLHELSVLLGSQPVGTHLVVHCKYKWDSGVLSKVRTSHGHRWVFISKPSHSQYLDTEIASFVEELVRHELVNGWAFL